MDIQKEIEIAKSLGESNIKTTAETAKILLSSKRGFYTSEFWITILCIIFVFVLLLIGKMNVNDVVDLWPVFTSVGAYSVSRSVVKSSSM